jgi:hypothetical protein
MILYEFIAKINLNNLSQYVQKLFSKNFHYSWAIVFSHYVKERSNAKGNFKAVIRTYDTYYALMHIIPSAVINFNFYFVKIYYMKGTIFSNPCYAEL